MSNFNIGQFMAEFQNGFQKVNQYRCRLPVQRIGLPRNSTQVTGPLAKRFPRAVEYLDRGLLCQSTRTPSRSFDTVPLAIYGYEEKYPSFTTYTDMECTFLAPLIEDPLAGGPTNQILEVFHAWQSLIQPRVLNSQYGGLSVRGSRTDGDMVMRFPDEYKLASGMHLELIDPYNTKRNEIGVDINVNLRVPVIGKVNLGFSARDKESQDEVQYASVQTMRYEFFEVYPITVESTQVAWNSNDEFQAITVTFAYSYWITNTPYTSYVPPLTSQSSSKS